MSFRDWALLRFLTSPVKIKISKCWFASEGFKKFWLYKENYLRPTKKFLLATLKENKKKSNC